MKKLEKLIIEHLPRDFLMACEDAYQNGDIKGRTEAGSFAKGHRPSAAGHAKHFRLNEAFHEALEAHGANPTPLRGTRLVVGRLGIFNIVRINVPGHKWINLGRSATRKELAALNDKIALKYVQSDLFGEVPEVAVGTIFIVGVMDGLDSNGIAMLTEVKIAIPAPDLRSWLYVNSISGIVNLYDLTDEIVQPDTALPKLKIKSKKQAGNDKGN